MPTKKPSIPLTTAVIDLPISDALKAIFIKRGFKTLGEIMEKPLGLHMQYLDLSMHQVMELFNLTKEE